MHQCALQDPGDDLHVPVRMGLEAGARSDDVKGANSGSHSGNCAALRSGMCRTRHREPGTSNPRASPPAATATARTSRPPSISTVEDYRSTQQQSTTENPDEPYLVHNATSGECTSTSRPRPTDPVEDPKSVSRWVRPRREVLMNIISVRRGAAHRATSRRRPHPQRTPTPLGQTQAEGRLINPGERIWLPH